MSRGRRLLTALLVVGTLVLSGCTSGTGTSGSEPTLRVLAGSELADMAPVLERAAEATGVRVEMRYAGSLAAADEVASGRAAETAEAVWISSTRYLDLDPRTRGQVGSAVPIMGSPVILGLRRSTADRLGWTGRPVSWADITGAAAARAFTFGMTDPQVSNTGFSALVGVAAAADGSGRAPDLESIARAAPALTGFFGAQTLTSGSSGYLVDAYVDRATGRVPGPPIDGIVSYEASLASLNRSGRLPEPLVPIHPTDGVVSADYPLAALTSVTPEQRDALIRLTEWLRSPAGQRDIAETTLRRPGNPAAGIPLRPDQPPVVELPFPGTPAVVEALLGAYSSEYRRPARTYYVLDTSGSMAGGRLEDLQQALVGLTGAEPGARGIRAREEITLVPFSSGVDAGRLRRFTVDPGAPDGARAEMRDAAAGLVAGGGTAIYDALGVAFAGLSQQPPDERITTVVLMTDGENTEGPDLAAGLAALDARPPATRGLPVFPILFGESATGEMTELAARTGGKVFDARTVPLAEIFRQIRSYQ